MNDVPLVSVLVPTYNGEDFLAEALAGIASQTHGNLEVLIRDDGSTDATIDIAAQYVNTDPRFYWISGEVRLGSTGSMIAMLKRARGSFIKVCNQDDVLHPECIATLIAPMLFDQSVVLSTSTRLLIDEMGAEPPATHFTEPLCDIDTGMQGAALIRHVLRTCRNQIGEPSTVLFRKGQWAPSETFTLDDMTYEFNNDIALWLKLLTTGHGYFCTRPLSKFRIHGQQRSADVAESISGTLEWPHLLSWGVRHGYLTEANDLMQAALYATGGFNWVTSLTERCPRGERAANRARIAEGLAHLVQVVGDTGQVTLDVAA